MRQVILTLRRGDARPKEFPEFDPVAMDALIGKTRGHFPTDEAATKSLYLALRNIQAKRQRGNHAWKAELPYLAMLFGSRFTDHA